MNSFAPPLLFLNTDDAQDLHLIFSVADVGMERNTLTPTDLLYSSSLATIIVSSHAPYIWFAMPVKAIHLMYFPKAALLTIWALLGV